MDTNRKESAPARYFELDAAKTLAIVFMVWAHVFDNMTTIDWLNHMPTDFLRNLLEFLGGPVAAPVFMFSMGVGMVCTRHGSPQEFIRRGIRLVIGGLVLNFFRLTLPLLIAQFMGVQFEALFSMLEGLLIADILSFAGLSFILTGLLKKLNVHPFMILALSILLQVAASWATVSIEPCTVPSMLLGFFVFTGKTSGFPLLLWYVYPAAGMAFACLLKTAEDRGKLYRKVLAISVAVLASLVCCLIQTGYDLRKIYTVAFLNYYMQDLYHTMFCLAATLIFISLMYFAFCGLSEDAKLMRFFRWCGMNLNTIYVFQWLVIPYTIAAMTLMEMEMITLPMVYPVGLVIALASMGLCAAWNRLRRLAGKKKD